MGTTIKVAMIDGDKDNIISVTNCLAKNREIEIVFTTNDGREAIGGMIRTEPDFIILDDNPDYLNGVEILTQMDISGLTSSIILYTSEITTNTYINQVTLLGVNEYRIKPCPPESIRETIEGYLAERNEKESLEEAFDLTQSPLYVEDRALLHRYHAFGDRKDQDMLINKTVTNILVHIGVPLKRKGFHYLVQSTKVMIYLRNRSYCVTKDVYPPVSRWFNVSVSVVEHCIRNAIRDAWIRYNRGEVLLDEFYLSFTKKPSNSEFMEMLAIFTEMDLSNELLRS